MNDLCDLELVINSRIPIVVIESHEEARVIDLLKRLVHRLAKPLFVWSVTEGLLRMEHGYKPQKHNTRPIDLLKHIKVASQPSIYLLLDFHPYLDDPVHVRLLKEIAQAYELSEQTVVLLSPRLDIPLELRPLTARFELSMPDQNTLKQLIQVEADRWSRENRGKRVRADITAFNLLVRNLSGLTASDAQRLARKAICDDGAITHSDLPAVMKAKYELINQDGILSFEYDTAKFSDVGGLGTLKRWLEQRKGAFHRKEGARGLEAPKGILLLGVQGCGKSLAAKAVAGMWAVPLLRLDFGALYNKYIGETERNLRESLRTAEVMAPCVLWIDEIEKGVSTGESDGGTSRRVLGTLLTWMAENKKEVFIVATANDIEALPPELIRKGRLDEIFFVDLPAEEVRTSIFDIHLRKRGLKPEMFNLPLLSATTEGFSGAEIEQVVVSALYSALAQDTELQTDHILSEIKRTRPLSVLMAEKIEYLRAWAIDRTVPAD